MSSQASSQALHVVSFEIFVKSMPLSLLELKVIPNFCITFKIPDDLTATILHYVFLSFRREAIGDRVSFDKIKARQSLYLSSIYFFTKSIRFFICTLTLTFCRHLRKNYFLIDPHENRVNTLGGLNLYGFYNFIELAILEIMIFYT